MGSFSSNNQREQKETPMEGRCAEKGISVCICERER